MAQKFGGLYRGIVVDNDDRSTDHPYLGRLKVSVPQVYGDEVADEDLPWAWPCQVMGQIGGEYTGKPYEVLMLPRIGAGVWVMFEQGDPESPVWMGCYLSYKAPEHIDSELGNELRWDGRKTSNVEYPDIACVKSPTSGEGMWLRFLGDKRVELVFDSSNYIELDADEQVIRIKSGQAWDVEIEATEDLRLKGKNIFLEALEGIQMLANKDINLFAQEKALLYGLLRSMVMSKNAIFGFAPAAQGFYRPPGG